ncbi:TlpA disulfide reductase family protein [Sphingomonas sp.]|uniref:TlpA family protein disulfide reductase n=1 Tax=Sphingomonas sp. TaxID=28214 RepID=UPI002D80DA34|nr:TlpA disulfide reductase family protein [Sphingomonas sp.]HEU0044942.1 TlpA disulfide reductase family protein [Sphingomonas sp.]
MTRFRSRRSLFKKGRFFKHALLRLTSLPIALLLLGAASEPKVGQMAPDAEITVVDGTKLKLSELKGEVVVLNFWATWCAPCKKELPLLDTYYKIQKKRGLRVFAVTTEGSIPLFRLKKVLAMLTIDSAKKISGPYGRVTAVPTNYIIDRSGRLRYGKASALDLDDLNPELVPLRWSLGRRLSASTPPRRAGPCLPSTRETRRRRCSRTRSCPPPPPG